MDIHYLLGYLLMFLPGILGGTSQCLRKSAGHDYVDQITSQPTEVWTDEPFAHYTNNFYRCWLIESELGGKVKLNFDFFRLQADESGVCTSDWLKVYDGDQEMTEDLLSTYCGSQNGTDVTSTGSHMLVIFSTDDTITDIGFRIFFFTVDADFNFGDSFGMVKLIAVIVVTVVVFGAVILITVVLCTYKKAKKTHMNTAKVGDNMYDEDLSPSVVITPLPEKC